jgi:glycosyltransferase domain-containing protein
MSAAAPAPRLTIVLPLRGRHLFTLRFLWYADKLRLPYRILIADGQVNEAVARHIENSRTFFPNLDIEYVRYPDDTGYARYFAKMADVMTRVRTPYAMLADNDDFLGTNGIEQALDFLEANPDYIAARGHPIAFQAYSGLGAPGSGVYGRINRLRMTYRSEDVSQPAVFERLCHGGHSLLIYYSVYRTEALAMLWREDSEIDFSDLMLHEQYHAMRTLTLGKVRTMPTISYFSQIGTSTSSDPMRDWASHLLRSHFTADVHDMVKRVASAAADAGADEAKTAEEVRSQVETYIRQFLWSNYGLIMQIKRFIRRNWPALVTFVQTRPRFFVWRERDTVLAKLMAAGATDEDLKRTRRDLAAVESALSRQSFLQFAAPFVSVARADGSRDWF